MKPWTSNEEPDAWLFLTPEVEREVPDLLELLSPGDGQSAERIETLIRSGDSKRWFSFLRDCRTRLERARSAGADDGLCRRLAEVLLEQYLLAPGVPGLETQDEREGRRLATLADKENAWASH